MTTNQKDPPISITRRRFLAATGLSLGAAAITSSCTVSPMKPREPVVGTSDDWSSVRNQFDLSHEYIHLATFALASHPRPVREAIEKYRRALDDNPFLVLDHSLWGTDDENFRARSEERRLTTREANWRRLPSQVVRPWGWPWFITACPLKPVRRS